ncbi:MAG TPA: hypothetical protein VF664_19135, partial [Cystobacter sp.]
MRQGKASVCLMGLVLGTTGLLGGCQEPSPSVTGPEPVQHGNEQPQTTPPEPGGSEPPPTEPGGAEPPPPSVDFAARVLHYDYGFDLRPTGDTPHPAHSRLLLQVPASGGDCTVLKGPPGITQVKWN